MGLNKKKRGNAICRYTPALACSDANISYCKNQLFSSVESYIDN